MLFLYLLAKYLPSIISIATAILTVSASGASDERITPQRRANHVPATSEPRPSDGCVWPQKRRRSLVLKNYGVQNPEKLSRWILCGKSLVCGPARAESPTSPEPRATPWVPCPHPLRPVRAKVKVNYSPILFPLQGVGVYTLIPRALPWALDWLPFQGACGEGCSARCP